MDLEKLKEAPAGEQAAEWNGAMNGTASIHGSVLDRRPGLD
jgi:hypothetical protein